MNHARNKALADRHELDIETELQKLYPNARRQPGSGNQSLSPNDIRVPKIMHVECKMTSAKSIILKFEWLNRLSRLALAFGVPGVLALRFQSQGDYFVIPADQYFHLLKCEQECQPS